MKNLLLTTSIALLLTACSSLENVPFVGSKSADNAEKTSADRTVLETTATASALDVILAAQDAKTQSRYEARHPKETIEFFGLTPGMKIGDLLPGNGWYGKILVPYLGSEGEFVGIDFNPEMWKLFGGFANEEFLAAKATWPATWTAEAEAWETGPNSAQISAFAIGGLPEDQKGTFDAILAFRTIHHTNRFEEEGGFQTAFLKDIHDALKVGGTFGVVQHRAPETSDAVWAEGDNGYVKQSDMIAIIEAAGFTLVDHSEINANPKDQPTSEDKVWRLPPSLSTSREDEELRAKMIAIGESDRMTLKFAKK